MLNWPHRDSQVVGPHRQQRQSEISQLGEGSRPASFTARRSGFAMRLLLLALSAFLAVAGVHKAAAQEFRGTISGTVTDSTGAVVPNAMVTAREVNTGTVNRTTSNGAGQYVIPFLLPGTYTIRAEASGFQGLERPGINLESQGHLIVNLALQIGANSETVTVSAAPPLIDLADASVGSVIQTESVANLPINGRAPTTLVEMAPGVISTGSAAQLIHPFDNNAGNQWSIGGTPNQVSEVLLDGSPDLTLLGAVAFEPTQDSVAEVSVRPL